MTPNTSTQNILRSGPHGLSEVAPLQPVTLDRVSKVYRDPMTLKPFTAVDEITFALERGEIFGLLGPNGSGKTTTIKVLLGLGRPTRGTVRIEGRDPGDPAARRRLGYLPETPCFYDHLTAVEYLEFVGALFSLDPVVGRRRAGGLLERLGLMAHARKPLRTFSKGMTQRLGLAQALLNEPALLVLDEPMSGLDPIGRAEVKRILREERERGVTILLSSHVLAETEALCDRVGILNGGRLLETGSIPGLVGSGVREWELVVDAVPTPISAEIASFAVSIETIGARAVIRVADGAALQRILSRLTAEGVFVHGVEPRRDTLEDHFMKALGLNGGRP